MMRLVATLLVRDEADIVAATVEHHLAQGAAMVVATDNGSVDGTAEVLAEYAAAGVVDLIYEPDQTYRQAAWVTRMARRAATEHGADWVVNLDADEFWLPRDRSLTLRSFLAGVPEEFDSIMAHRTDLLGVRGSSGPWPRRLRWRNLRTVSERGTPLAPKVCHRANPEVQIAQGNHEVSGMATMPGDPLEIYHVPLRSWPQFRRKIANGGSSYAASTELDPEVGWHWRVDHERLLSGELEGVFRARELGAPQVVARLIKGALVRDSFLLHHLQRIERTAVRPDLLRAVLVGAGRPVGGHP